jgi:hypothetical protein
MSHKSDIQKLTDLCCCVNAFEGYFMAYHHGVGDKVYFRQRKAMTDCIKELATKLFKAGVSLKRLDAALHNGGWYDNFFIYTNGILEIHCK